MWPKRGATASLSAPRANDPAFTVAASRVKLHHDTPAGMYAVTGYGEGYVLINGERHETNLIVQPERIVVGWAGGGLAALTDTEFETLRDLRPEIVLLGTGLAQHFPPPALFRPLIEARIGFEIMDTPAACRTYNILMGEGRNVAAALLIAVR